MNKRYNLCFHTFKDTDIQAHPITGALIVTIQRSREFLISAIMASASSELLHTAENSEYPVNHSAVDFHNLTTHLSQAESQEIGTFLMMDRLEHPTAVFSKTHSVVILTSSIPPNIYYKAIILEVTNL